MQLGLASVLNNSLSSSPNVLLRSCSKQKHLKNIYSCLCELADLWCEDKAKLTYEASKETYIPPNSFPLVLILYVTLS